MRYRSLCLSFFLAVGFIVASTAHAATASSTHLILRMGDGRFYDPLSGRSAATEEELLVPPVSALSQGFVTSSSSESGVPIFLPTSSTTVDVATSTPATTTPPFLPESPLSLAVQRGKQLLVGRQLMTTDKAKTDQDWRLVDLAVWTPETDVIVPVRIQKKGANVKVVGTSDFQVQVRTANGLDSTYIITSLATASTTPKVVAVRYPLYHPVKAGKKTTYRIEEVIYTPYARSLHAPEIVARGKVFLDQQMDAVYADLREKKIASATYPDKLVTDVVRPEVAKAILLIEHTDQTSLKTDPQNTVETFFAELGLNENLTYAYEESPVGASGAPQFMPATYQLLAKKAELELDPDFTRGMRDLKNGMTAQVVYLDRLLAVMPDTVQDAYLTQPYEAGAYVVASYNAGEVRIRRAVQAYGDEWDANHAGQAAALQVKQASVKKNITAFKAKLKTKAVKASAAQTKAVKKQLATAQSQYDVLSSQIDALQKSSLRPETFYYLQKYRLALPYLGGSLEGRSASTTTATVQAASL